MSLGEKASLSKLTLNGRVNLLWEGAMAGYMEE